MSIYQHLPEDFPCRRSTLKCSSAEYKFMPYLHQEVNRLYFVSSFKGQDLFQTQGIVSMFFESHLKVSLLDTHSIFKFQSTDLGEWESNDS